MSENEKHIEKMKRLKTSKQKIFEKKTMKKGLIIVHTGTGKGKSTAAFGMVFRGIAHGMPCAVVQFIKGAMATGERDLIQKYFHELCEFHTLGDGFTWDTQDKEKDIAIVLIRGKFFTEQYHWVVYPIDNVKSFWGKNTVIDSIYLIKKKGKQ